MENMQNFKNIALFRVGDGDRYSNTSIIPIVPLVCLFVQTFLQRDPSTSNGLRCSCSLSIANPNMVMAWYAGEHPNRKGLWVVRGKEQCKFPCHKQAK